MLLQHQMKTLTHALHMNRLPGQSRDWSGGDIVCLLDISFFQVISSDNIPTIYIISNVEIFEHAPVSFSIVALLAMILSVNLPLLFLVSL